MAKFQGRDNFIFNLHDFYKKDFAEKFFSCYRSENEKTIFITNESFQEDVHAMKISFQIDDFKLLEDEIYDIIQTRDQSSITIYFTQLEKYRNANFPYDQTFINKEFQNWNTADPELFSAELFPKYITFLNDLHHFFLTSIDTHLILYHKGQYDKQGTNLSQQSNTPMDKTQTIWFRVGLLFANGEMARLIKKHNRNYTKIAKELNNPSFRPYISESANNTNNTDKNIFSNISKMKAIKSYCEEQKIDIDEAFLRLLNKIDD